MIGHSVGYCRGTEPRSLGISGEKAGGLGLTAGFDPVIDEQNAIAAVDRMLAETEAEVTVLTAGWCGAPQPGSTVAGSRAIFANFTESDAEGYGDERPEGDRWLLVGSMAFGTA